MPYIRIYDPKEVRHRRLSPHFSAIEFACKHCGKLIINDELVCRFEQLREAIKSPIKITSGFRCLEHNRQVGSKDTSLHVKGDAADFVTLRSLKGIDVLFKATEIFNRVGYYQSSNDPNRAYIHADLGPKHLYWLSYYDAVKRKRLYIYYNSLEHMISAMRNNKKINWLSLVI